MSTTTLTITTELLREWQACKDGYSWFVSKFPQGGAYEDVQSALKADKRADDLRWLTDRMFESLLKTPSLTALAVKWFQADAPDFEVASVNAEDAPAHDQDYAQIGSSGDAARIGSSGHSAQIGSSGSAARIGSSGNYARIGSSGSAARIGSSGHYAQIGSSGSAARIGSSGNYAQIGSSGHSAQIGSSGYSARIGSSGYSARIGSSGDAAQIGSSGNYARINAEGARAVIASAGLNARVRAGEEGAVAVAYHDGNRIRFAVGYVGENLKALTWYSVNDAGEFVEVSE